MTPETPVDNGPRLPMPEAPAEARDALAVALAFALGVEDHPRGYVPRTEAQYRSLADQAISALPDGWVLARLEDAEDGAALRELREALGDDTLMRLENLMPDTPREGGSDLWLVEVEVDAPGEPTVLVADATGPTIAAAARKAKEALG